MFRHDSAGPSAEPGIHAVVGLGGLAGVGARKHKITLVWYRCLRWKEERQA
jgi:hypothetical protein